MPFFLSDSIFSRYFSYTIAVLIEDTYSLNPNFKNVWFIFFRKRGSIFTNTWYFIYIYFEYQLQNLLLIMIFSHIVKIRWKFYDWISDLQCVFWSYRVLFSLVLCITILLDLIRLNNRMVICKEWKFIPTTTVQSSSYPSHHHKSNISIFCSCIPLYNTHTHTYFLGVFCWY